MKKWIVILKFALILFVCAFSVFIVYNSIPVNDKWLSNDVFKLFEDFKLNFVK